MKAWLVKSAVSAAYWFGCLHAIGALLGDRIVDGRIVPPPITIPPAVLMLVAVIFYALFSFLWDRRRARSGGR